MTLERIFTVATAIAVVGGIAAGFSIIGSPSHARETALDAERIRDLQEIAERLHEKRALPSRLDALALARRYDHADIAYDPVTKGPYAYQRIDGEHYRLCATFTPASDAADADPRWRHRAGTACFRFARESAEPENPQ